MAGGSWGTFSALSTNWMQLLLGYKAFVLFVLRFLAQAECNFEAPFQFRRSVEVLQGLHAGLSVASARVAVAEDGLQSYFAAVVVVTQVQGQVTRTLEAEVPGQLCFRLRT
jgi:hypothetical protein